MSGEPSPAAVVEEFLVKLQDAFTKKDVAAIEAIFLPNGYLRE